MMVLKVRRLIIVYSRTPVTEVSVTEMIPPMKCRVNKVGRLREDEKKTEKLKIFFTFWW